MNLKLSKTFSGLKFKPNIFQPLSLDLSSVPQTSFDMNRPLQSFQDIIKIDYVLASNITNTKASIRKLIDAVKACNAKLVIQVKACLKDCLQVILQIVEKLEFENIKKNMRALFEGEDGIYSLYRYAWSPDLLHLMCKLKSSYELKQTKEMNPNTVLYFRKAEKQCQIIEEVMHKQANALLKQFTSQMYMIPIEWGTKLVGKANFEEKIQKAFDQVSYENTLTRLLELHKLKDQQQFDSFRLSLYKAFFYLQIEQQFYCYLTFLKAILLNKVSGIFNGDYETWQLVYDVCLKIYCRKQSARGKTGIQIDQLIQHQTQDIEFTNFLLNSNLDSVSLCSIVFYFKNCPNSSKNKLRPIVTKKIIHILKVHGLRDIEDIVEYLSTEALPEQKDEIISIISDTLTEILQRGIKANEYFEYQKGFSDLLEYLLKNESNLNRVITVNLFSIIYDTLNKPESKEQSFRTNILFLHNVANNFFIQSYEEEFDFKNYISSNKDLISITQNLIFAFKDIHGLQMHENAYPIILDWKKILDSDFSDSQSEDESKQCQEDLMAGWAGHIATLMLVSGRQCDFKLENTFNSSEKKDLIANEITVLFRKLSDAQFQERKSLQSYLQYKQHNQQTSQQKMYAQSFLIVKGFKDRLLHENIMNLAIKLHPSISFSEVALFAVEFLTLMTPSMIDDPFLGGELEHGGIEPYDVCDIVSGEQPIECMKFIYKKLPDFDESGFNFECFSKLPLEAYKLLGSCNNSRMDLAKFIAECQFEFDITLIEQVQQFKKFFFYAQLMTKVFHKLNEKSQKGIKQIKIIFEAVEKICFKIWEAVSNRVISSQIFFLCKDSFTYKQKMLAMTKNLILQEQDSVCQSQIIEFSHATFSSLIKQIKLPYIDSILIEGNYFTKTCQQFICGIGKVLNPISFKKIHEKLFNPFGEIKIQALTSKNKVSAQFIKNYQFVGEIIKALAMIQFACCNQEQHENRERDDYKEYSIKWRKNCKEVTQRLLLVIQKSDETIFSKETNSEPKNLWTSVFLVHLKAEIIKILIPFMIKDTLKYPHQNPKCYNTQLTQTFTNFSIICQIVQKITPGQQQHLMTFLQIFEGYDVASPKNISNNIKTSEFLYKSIEVLLELVFKGIRVRSYHFYKFIRSYLRLTKEKENYLFFNSIIAYYIQYMMKDIMGEFTLPETIRNFCDENINLSIKSKSIAKIQSNKQNLINEQNLKKSVNKIRFCKFVRFEAKFEMFANKVCIISMFINLFCRLNFKSLTQGIERIWDNQHMHLLYIEYLTKISHFLQPQLNLTDQKLLDIINVDCFGNLSIIFCNPRPKSKSGKTQAEEHQIIYELLKLTKQVISTKINTRVKNALELPVKKITTHIKSSVTSTQTIDYISQTIAKLNLSTSFSSPTASTQKTEVIEPLCNQILDMILACYNTKLTRGITSNVHHNNLMYICLNSDLKARVFDNNISSLEKRMGRREIRATIASFGKQKQKQKGKKKEKKNKLSSILKIAQRKQSKSEISETWVNISQHSESLIQYIIQNFIFSYEQTFKKSNQDKELVQTLFNNLKIMSLVTVNNPQVIQYLTKFKSKHSDLTVLQIMWDSAIENVSVFAELYIMFLKTNFGFVVLKTLEEDKILPNNFQIEVETKEYLLNKLQFLLRSKSLNKELQNLLKTIDFICKVSNCPSKPYFRSYKFGAISNFTYTQLQTKNESDFFKKLTNILKQGITQIGNHSQINYQYLQLLTLHEQSVTKILKDSDLTWMKLHLDLQLKTINNTTLTINQFDDQNSLKISLGNQGLSIGQSVHYIDNTFKYSEQECIREISALASYNFSHDIIGEDILSILSSIDSNAQKESSKIILQKLIEYSAKQSIWQGENEDQEIVIQYPDNNSLQSSYGLTIIGSEHENNASINHNEAQTNNMNLNDGIIESEVLIQGLDSREQVGTDPNIQYDNIIQNDDSDYEVEVPVTHIPQSQGIQFDGIMQDDDEGDEIADRIEEHLQNINSLKELMSETSLHFLSHHSVKNLEQQIEIEQEEPNYSKQYLLELYEESTINPQARKQLINAISQADASQLEKFIANQSVDEQIEMIVVRQLYGRGILPSCTSISKNSKYCGNLMVRDKQTVKCLNLYVNQAVLYKKMYENYERESLNNPTNLYIPILSKDCVKKIMALHFISLVGSAAKQNQLWKLFSKLCLNPINCYNIIETALNYLSLNETEFIENVQNMCGLKCLNSVSDLKLMLVNDLFGGCIKDRIGLHLILTGFWDSQNKKLANNYKVSYSYDQTGEMEISLFVPVLEFLLKDSSLIDEVLTSHGCEKQKSELKSKKQIEQNFLHIFWEYLQKCDEFKVQNKTQKYDEHQYPYYQIQESIQVSQGMIRKIVDRLFNDEKVIGSSSHKDKQEISLLEELFTVLIYLDPVSFETYFKVVVEKVTQKLSEIVRKQQKILTTFKTNCSLMNEKDWNCLEMQKQEKYWNLRQSKKSMFNFEKDLKYCRNVLVDISVNVLSKFKKIRFNYHCGKSYREWKLDIEVLREKLLSFGSVQGLYQLEDKERELQDWRRNRSNEIISQQIIPIVEQHTEQFMRVLSETQSFISDFMETFEMKQSEQKLVIYNTCAKLYEILLASEILTHEEKTNYHSMSKLKTNPSIQSSKNLLGSCHRKSSLQYRKSGRISIKATNCMPKVEALLRKIGPSCTYLNQYLGNQANIRQLHAKYSDINKRLKILWTDREQVNENKCDREKIISCRREHILEDTLSEIDDDFINLPVKIKFEGEIGIDYGGVTREWITLFMKEIIDPSLGLFELSANGLTFQPNHNSTIIPNHLRYFKKIGILVGKAMKQNWLLQVNLTKSFLKHVLGNTLYIEDLEDIDPETVKSLKWILDNDIGYDDDLALNFTYEIEKFGTKKTVDLVLGGSGIPVTEQNKKKYVKMIANNRMTEGIREQSKAFMSGLELVIPYSTLSLFSYKEISLYLSGMPTIDIKQMEKFAKHETFTPESQQIVWFWKIIAEWNQEELANFLFFLTGSYKVPYGGFKQHPIGFNKLPSCTDYLPVAHTCFSVIDLSQYSSMQRMGKLLRKSIKQGKGFSVS